MLPYFAASPIWIPCHRQNKISLIWSMLVMFLPLTPPIRVDTAVHGMLNGTYNTKGRFTTYHVSPPIVMNPTWLYDIVNSYLRSKKFLLAMGKIK
jgi:hypothetical protein